MAKKPCRECPFRKKSLKGYIGGHEDAIEIYDVLDSHGKFPCHLATAAIKNNLLDQLGGDDDDALAMTDDEAFEQACREAPHCTGALIFMNNSCKRSRNPATAALQDAAGKSTDVFLHASEFLIYHGSKAFEAMGRRFLPAWCRESKK